MIAPLDRRRMALRMAAEHGAAVWRKMLSGPGSGRLYPAGLQFITKGGRVIPIQDKSGVRRSRAAHRASRPGDAPAKDSGGTASRIYVNLDNPDAPRPASPDRHLLALEHGVNVAGSQVGTHPGGIVIAPRPSARPAMEEAIPEMRKIMLRVLRGK